MGAVGPGGKQRAGRGARRGLGIGRRGRKGTVSPFCAGQASSEKCVYIHKLRRATKKGDAIPFSLLTLRRGSVGFLVIMFLDPSKEIARHRVNLPHWQQGEVWLFVTWRLADSLPEAVVRLLDRRRKDWEVAHPKPWGDEERKEHNRLFRLGFEKLLDDAHGSCALRDAALGGIVADALLHFHGERYQLDCFVVMPNHVHVLFHPLGENKLEDIVGTWKRFTARQINKALGKEGALWQREYWDRLVRGERHFAWVREYIARNPEKLAAATFRLWFEGDNKENGTASPLSGGYV